MPLLHRHLRKDKALKTGGGQTSQTCDLEIRELKTGGGEKLLCVRKISHTIERKGVLEALAYDEWIQKLRNSAGKQRALTSFDADRGRPNQVQDKRNWNAS